MADTLRDLALGTGTLPITMLVLLPHGEARDAEVVGDIVDDQRHEACVGEERDGKRRPDHDRSIAGRGLKQRGTESTSAQATPEEALYSHSKQPW